MSNMTVFRVEKKGNYTCMSNDFFHAANLSFKAKGLLGLILTFKPTWKITLSGLETESKDGIAAIRTGLLELIEAGYIIRRYLRHKGKITGVEYVIFESPELKDKWLENQDEAVTDDEVSDNVVDILSQTENCDISDETEPEDESPGGNDEQEDFCKDVIYNNLEIENFEVYAANGLSPYKEILPAYKNIAGIMINYISLGKKFIKLGGKVYGMASIKESLLKIRHEHVFYTIKALEQCEQKIHDRKAYTLAVLLKSLEVVEKSIE